MLSFFYLLSRHSCRFLGLFFPSQSLVTIILTILYTISHTKFVLSPCSPRHQSCCCYYCFWHSCCHPTSWSPLLGVVCLLCHLTLKGKILANSKSYLNLSIIIIKIKLVLIATGTKPESGYPFVSQVFSFH